MPDRLIKQPTAAPTRKVGAAALWGTISSGLIVAATLLAPEAEGPVRDFLGSIPPLVLALAPYVPVVAAYFTRERDTAGTAAT